MQALHQLRPLVADFVGRADEIAQVVAAGRAVQGRGAATATSGIRSLGGSGKTELAYAVAACLDTEFPAAQLLLELRGAGDKHLPPAQALQQVIRTFCC
jgi:hypothetical protein